MSINRLRKALELDWEEDFALVIRGYPVTTTRVDDLTQWEEPFTPNYIDYHRIESINWARKAWHQYELPRLLAAANGGFDLEPGRSYFDWFLRSAYRELTLMLTTGVSPASGNEKSTDHAHHTHLQNHTTANSHVEWTPLGRVEDTNPKSPDRTDHLFEVIQAEHDAVVNIGACCLSPDDFYLIPNFQTFLDSTVGRLAGKRSYLTPPNVRLIRQRNELWANPGRGDYLRAFLNGYQKMFESAY